MRRVAPRLGLLALAWLAATGEVGVCPLFRPATPEQGGTGTIIPTDYTDPDSTLATMARGIAGKGEGIDAYMGGIADTVRDVHLFRAFTDPAVESRYLSTPGALPIPVPWSTDNERHFFSAFVTYRKTAYTMIWGPDQFNPVDDLGSDLATLHRHYLITTRLTDGSDLVIAVGYVDLLMVRTTAGRWVVVIWNDRVDPAFGGADPPNPEQVAYSWRRLTQRG
jgi:hypothetical protein